MKKLQIFLVSLLVMLMFAGCASSPKQYDLPERYPMEFRPWLNDSDDVVDYVMFNQEIDPSLYSKLVVLPIDQSSVVFDSFLEEGEEKEERDEDSDETAISYLAAIDYLYWDNLGSLDGLIQMPLVQADSAADGEHVLLLETDVLIVNPGSRGARYMVGFGVGATELKLEGRLVDSETGDVLVSFTHASFGWGGSFGGDSYELLEENMKTIAVECFGSLLYSVLGE